MFNLGLNITFVAIEKKSPVFVINRNALKITELVKKQMLIQLLVGFVFVCLSVQSLEAQARHRMELGGFVGMSNYYGDLNTGNPFYHPHLAVGAIGRYNVTDRFAFKGTVNYGSISGASDDVLFVDGEAVDYAFGNKQIGDLAIQLEFNFLSYDNEFIKDSKYTPYISFGLGTTAYKRFSTNNQGEKAANTVFTLSLPFSTGIKYKINNWIRIGAEWRIQKMFVDDLDVDGSTFDIYPDDPLNYNKNSKLHNNDWYSYAGAYVTFSMFRRKTSCNSGF